MPLGSSESLDLTQFSNRTYFETGFFRGESALRALACGAFERVISLEVSQAHYDEGREKLKLPILSGLLDLRLGDSSELWKHICEIEEPMTFFLDAHDDQATVAKGGNHDSPIKPCPLFDELDAIAKHSIKTHTILIDDRRCFQAGFEHPEHTWFQGIREEDLRTKLLEINPAYNIFYVNGLHEDDILVASPPKP